MNETTSSERAIAESDKPDKPVKCIDDVKLPPFSEPSDEDFEDDIPDDEKKFCKNKFADLNNIRNEKLHCTACDRHLGCSARNESKLRVHPLLRTLVCQTCHTFYNSGEFEKGDDGSELYCRWCGQGGQVFCCAECPHVFCARCIRRNMGAPKIKEIESAEDWKCFRCNPSSLWDLRSICWALLRYCDLKNKLVSTTEDPVLKEAYQNLCSRDDSTCCKAKTSKRREKEVPKKKEEIKKPSTAAIISKIPSTIQVKKFASINLEEVPKVEKKAQKRPASPRHKPAIIKTPIAVAPCPKVKSTNNVNIPLIKKLKLQPVMASYSRIRPKGQVMPQMPIPIISSPYNGFHNSHMFGNNMNNAAPNDNINLSLENLTQGLDMASMSAMPNHNDNDVVCTPDFPMEPLCEVTEDNDDDVQCITPKPGAASRVSVNPPPLVARTGSIIPEINSENIIQMTENDVTVNATTGGLKFRVDPQTLSSNNMYRLPDGRIFAINANPNMPGGYSATIVALTEANNQTLPRGATYAAKLSTVSTANSAKSPSLPQDSSRNIVKSKKISNLSMTSGVSKKSPRTSKSAESPRECDLSVPVEWYRYNLIDAVDALEYSLARLNKLKKETTSMFLRTRSVKEMRSLHRALERLLNTSASRFVEIRENLNKGLRQYITKKMGGFASDDDDDDDVEILPDMDENDDPIFIDENSIDSNANDSQEVDLTVASSDHNDSGETKEEVSTMADDPLAMLEGAQDIANLSHRLEESLKKTIEESLKKANKADKHISETKKADKKGKESKHKNGIESKKDLSGEITDQAGPKKVALTNAVDNTGQNVDTDSKNEKSETSFDVNDTMKAAENDKCGDNEKDNNEKIQDPEMSEEMIETLLKDDGGGEGETTNLTCLEELTDT